MADSEERILAESCGYPMPALVTKWDRLRALAKEHTLSPDEMKIITDNFLRTEKFVTLYMLLCTWFQEYQSADSTCEADPPMVTATFAVCIFLPFYLSRIFSRSCCRTP